MANLPLAFLIYFNLYPINSLSIIYSIPLTRKLVPQTDIYTLSWNNTQAALKQSKYDTELTRSSN